MLGAASFIEGAQPSPASRELAVFSTLLSKFQGRAWDWSGKSLSTFSTRVRHEREADKAPGFHLRRGFKLDFFWTILGLRKVVVSASLKAPQEASVVVASTSSRLAEAARSGVARPPHMTETVKPNIHAMAGANAAEQLSASSAFSRNGYHQKMRAHSIDSNSSSRSSATESLVRSSLNGKRLSDVCEDQSMDGSQQPSPHQPRAQTNMGQSNSSEQSRDSGKGILGWIQSFANLGRRTQSSIDMPVPPKVQGDALQASVPRRSYSESELVPRRRAAGEYIRPSAEVAAPHRRSTESQIDTRPSSEYSHGRPSVHEDDYQAIMQRRRKAVEALFAGEGLDNHFLNEELAARSSLFNSGN
ncbi:hypothetical protein WJX74_000606 [Apatococcus lobatus]|uniref:Uncharacterized protein n=1 Tax=Apatococcus lobatus TaxID=904363 RepID=A0AAW1RHC9_9CHLO